MVDLSQLFDKSVTKRDKFLARLLGLFSEEIVHIWTRDENCRFEDLGRLTVTNLDTSKRYTLDFTLSLKSQQPKTRFVTEMKCWTEYDGYKFLNLATEKQLEKLNSPAFEVFLTMVKQPEKFAVKLSKEEIIPDGNILIWSRAEPTVIESVKQAYGLHDVLTLENIINDLVMWNSQEYQNFLNERKDWCYTLFDTFAG